LRRFTGGMIRHYYGFDLRVKGLRALFWKSIVT
jgi:hypothetical protein